MKCKKCGEVIFYVIEEGPIIECTIYGNVNIVDYNKN